MNLNQYTLNNKNHFKERDLVVCIDCLSEYDVFRIKDYCDDGQTAICPYCWNDTVILSPQSTTLYTNEDIIKYRSGYLDRPTINKQITFVNKETFSFNK
jgi:hypothetical protein